MTSLIKSIINENVLGKTVLIRADLNLPISNGEILDQSRVERVTPIKAIIVFTDINRVKNFINNCSFIIKNNANIDFFFI